MSPKDMVADPFRIPLSALPTGAAPAERPEAARIFAVGLGDAEQPSAFAVLRQRRTTRMMMVIGWQCDEALSAELADAVLTFAASRDARLIRATTGRSAAITALGLSDSGRGYAQRWIGTEIVSPHHTGQFTQTTGFTCGPVSVAMAMGGDVTRAVEIEIWREATTIRGLTGPGGCDPYGTALAAARRGFNVELWFDATEAVLLDRANSAEKQNLMRFVQSEFRAEAERQLTIHREALDGRGLTQAVQDGAQVILLIDQCHTHDHHAPHWVLLHAENEGCFLVNDPWAEPDDGETVADVDCIPIDLETLVQMGAYGDPAYRAALVLYHKP